MNMDEEGISVGGCFIASLRLICTYTDVYMGIAVKYSQFTYLRLLSLLAYTVHMYLVFCGVR